jgi:hypothetical protein
VKRVLLLCAVSKDGTAPGVAVELLVPDETFGGVSFQLTKTSAEFVEIGQAIKSGGVERPPLREFPERGGLRAQDGVGRSGMAGAPAAAS